VDARDRRGWRLGGAVTYAALAIARLGLSCRVLIGVDDEAASAHELGLLLAAGCEIEYARLAHGPVFDNQEDETGRHQIARAVSDRIGLRELPPDWRDTPAILMAPVADELGPHWAEAFPATAIVGLGWQGVLRRLSPGERVKRVRPRSNGLFRRADLGVVSAEDFRHGAGNAALRRMLPRPGQQLLISNGAHPLLHLLRTEGGLRGRILGTDLATHVSDTTGAGDTLMAAWFAGHVATRAAGVGAHPSRLVRFAIAAATAKVESGGLADMPDLRTLCDRLLRPPA